MGGEKNITFRQNPKIDFLFGFFGGAPIPTKQDAFKPIDVTGVNDEGEEVIFNNFYIKNPDTASIKVFESYIKELARGKIPESEKINKPNHVQVHLSISVTERRFFEVDVDNLAKNVLDCLKGIAYEDDSQVTSLNVEKHIHPMKMNGIFIAITKITEKRKGLEFNW